MSRPVHFDITADDPDRAVAFYEKVFGWKITHWGDGGPMEYWLITTGLNDAMAAIRESGGEIIQERAPIPGVGWFAAFTDTEGNRFGLMQPDDSAA
jgi:predicted enzyme related to lactoylglutathione lyase